MTIEHSEKRDFSKEEMTSIAFLQTAFEYEFKRPDRLMRALTHSSVGAGSKNGEDYERLEFLGDRVVNLVIADLIFFAFPDEQEGDLARRHTAFVRGEALAKAARKLDIQSHIRVSMSEKAAGGAENDNILADSMEALMAALYLDAGYAKVYDFLKAAVHEDIQAMEAPPVDAKTALQEWSQARKLGLPEYKLDERRGPDHAPEFVVSVRVLKNKKAGEYYTSTSIGASKRNAEKAAARAMIKNLSDSGVFTQ